MKKAELIAGVAAAQESGALVEFTRAVPNADGMRGAVESRPTKRGDLSDLEVTFLQLSANEIRDLLAITESRVF